MHNNNECELSTAKKTSTLNVPVAVHQIVLLAKN